MSEKQIVKVNYKEEDAFLNLISVFRTSLDQLNTVFIDLIQYHAEMKDKCTNIAKINNECIRNFLYPDDKSYNLLIHQNSIYIIENYLNEKESKAPKLLNEINEEIKEKFDAFLKSPKSPYKLKYVQSKNLHKKLDKFKNAINETQYQSGIIDDYLGDISSLFQKSFDINNYNDDDDDDDDSSKNDRRFYGDAYPSIPEALQVSIRQFMAYINSQILIKNILGYDNSINKCYEKLKIPRPIIKDFKEAYEKLLEENQNLKQQIQKLEDEKADFNKENRKKDKQIKSLEGKCLEADTQIRELKSKVNELTRQMTKAKPTKTTFVPKDDDKYLDAVSYFRKAIDNMNSSFMDLLKYDQSFQSECKAINHINNKFINDIINDDLSDLTHFTRLNDVYQYYTSKDENEKTNICVLLNQLKRKIEIRFKYFKPFKLDYLGITHDQNANIRKYLKNKRQLLQKMNFAVYNEPDNDFMTDKIEQIFKNHKDDNDDDDDDDDSSRNDRRYYGNPYPTVPDFVQKKVNQFMAYANTLVTINSILEFDKYVDSRLQNVSNQSQKKQITLVNEFFSKFKMMAEKVDPIFELLEEGPKIDEKIRNMHDILHRTLKRSKTTSNIHA